MNNRKFTKGTFNSNGFQPEFDSKPSGRNPYKQGFKLGFMGTFLMVITFFIVAFLFMYSYVPEFRIVVNLFI